MRPLPPADRPGARRPARRLQVQAGQLGDLGAVPIATIGIHGRTPGVGRERQDRGAYPAVQVEPDREPHTLSAEVVDQPVGGAGRVGADQDRLLLACLARELGKGEVDHVDLVGGGVGRGVAWP
jgi:hypothetical protein